jgi:hypothetical protein
VINTALIGAYHRQILKAAQRVCSPTRAMDGLPTGAGTQRIFTCLTWEPVSGIEPLTCRLQEVRPRAPGALAASMVRVIALMAPVALGLSSRTFHEPFHADEG